MRGHAEAIIRLARPDDAAAMLAIYAPLVRETIISFQTEPPSEDVFLKQIRATLRTHPWLVLDVGGTVAGYAYAAPHRKRDAYQWSAEVSVYVHPDFRQRGVARALYTSLFAALRVQGFVSVYAGITQPNAASTALHRALKFEPVGVYRSVGYKQGAWRDVAWWQRSLWDERPPDPASPRPPEAVRATEAWGAALRSGQELLNG